MLSGRGITGVPPPSGVCGMGAIRVGMGLISGQRMTPGKPLASAMLPAEASGMIVGGRRPACREAGPAGVLPAALPLAAGAAHHIGNHAADGQADGEQDGERESEKGARHALGRFGLDAARGQREDGGQGGAGGEREAGQGMDDAAARRRRRFAG